MQFPARTNGDASGTWNETPSRTTFKRAEFSVVQADALADILTEHASRSELRADFRRLEKNIDLRFDASDARAEDRFNAFAATMEERSESFEMRMNERFVTFTQTIDSKLDGIEDRWTKALSRMEARLTWRLVALGTFMGTVMTFVSALLG